MVLELTPVAGEPQRFWVSRRLWISLHGAILQWIPASPEGQPVPPKQPRGPILPEDPVMDAVLLDSIRLERKPDHLRFVFASARGETVLTIPEAGFPRLKRMLETQADRAGWDLPAAMERVRAEGLAKAAMCRART
jgi:hypothetical protein